MKRIWIASSAIALLSLVLLSLFLPGNASPALAQGPTRVMPTLTLTPVPSPTVPSTPDPTQVADAAFFTVTEAGLESRYPAGVEYILRVSSSAGEITQAVVLTWASEVSSQRQPLEWDESRGAWVFYERFYRPPWIELNYRFRVSDSAGHVLETEPVTTEYNDHTRQWTRLEDSNVIVLFFGAPESLGQELFASASNAIVRLEEAFGFKLDYKPYVVVVPDTTSLQEWQEHPDPHMAGQTRWVAGYTIQSLAWGDDFLIDAVLPHELTHIFQGFILEAFDIDGWFIEGHATYFEPVPDYDYEDRVRQFANHEDFPTLQRDIGEYEEGPDGIGRWRYDVGYTFIRYWIETYGWESHQLFWQAQVEMDFHEALEHATGRAFEELEIEWRAFIGATGPPPTLIPTPAFLDPSTIPTPTYASPG